MSEMRVICGMMRLVGLQMQVPESFNNPCTYVVFSRCTLSFYEWDLRVKITRLSQQLYLWCNEGVAGLVCGTVVHDDVLRRNIRFARMAFLTYVPHIFVYQCIYRMLT